MLKSICIALFLCGGTLAVIQEQGLYSFCRHDYMDFLGDMPVDERVKNDYCEQKIEMVVENEKQAKLVCRRAVPFAVKEATLESDGTVRCKWESSTTCENANHLLISGRCFHLGKMTKASDAHTACNGKSSLHTVKSLEEAKFLSFLLPNHQPIHVFNNAKETSHDLFDKNQLIYTKDSFEPRSDESPVNHFILNMEAYDLYESRPGKLVGVKDDVQLRALCSEPSIVYGDKEESFEQIPEHLMNIVEKVNGNLAIKTMNVHQPSSSSRRDVSTKNLHQVCQNLCEECFAALPNMGPELGAHHMIKHVSGFHKSDPTLPKENDECKSDIAWKVNRANFQTEDETGSLSGVEGSRFAANYPNNMCADGLNTALISMPNADLHDSPTITRHPIVCVKGTKPQESRFSMCRQNSEELPGGGCKCKEGYKDILDTTIAQRTNFVPGQMCTLDKPCSKKHHTLAFTFVLDYSSSIKVADLPVEIAFVQSAASTIPRFAPVNSIVFAEHVQAFDWLPADQWVPADFAKLTPSRVYLGINSSYFIRDHQGRESWIGLETSTDKALEVAIDKMRGVNVERKFFILITDGNPTRIPEAIAKAQELRQHGIKLLIVPVGNVIDNLAVMEQMVENPRRDIFDLTGDMKTQLTEKAMQDIIEILCEPTTWEDYQQEMK